MFFARLSKQYGFTIHCHQLRKTFANVMNDAGTDLPTIQKMMGHSTPAITSNTYISCPKEKQQKAHNKAWGNNTELEFTSKKGNQIRVHFKIEGADGEDEQMLMDAFVAATKKIKVKSRPL